MKKSNRSVVRHGNGWAVKKDRVPKPESVHRKQANAEAAAKKRTRAEGGGEVRIQNRQGKWRDSDTMPPARDPFPPRDKKH